MKKVNNIKAGLDRRIDEIEEYINKNIPQRGDTSEDCQKIALINVLAQVRMVANGLTEEDLQAISVKAI